MYLGKPMLSQVIISLNVLILRKTALISALSEKHKRKNVFLVKYTSLKYMKINES